MRPPSYEGAAMARTLCLCRSLILFRRVESGAGLILIAGRDGKLSATLAKNAWRSGRNISLTVVRLEVPLTSFCWRRAPLARRSDGATYSLIRNGVRTWPITLAKAIIDDLCSLNGWLFISSLYRPIIPDP